MKKRVFISFAVEDVRFRDFLVGQSKNDQSPFEFVDMSVKEPWKSDWKERCKTKIKSCDGVIGFISKNTPNASGEIFELECGYEEGLPVMLMYINDDRPNLPTSLSGKKIYTWNWPNIESFMGKL